MDASTVTTADGSALVVHSVGTGPGIVVLHGGGVTWHDYRRLARALSDRFTAHLYNRRGRPGAAPLNGTETVTTDLDDLNVVLQHTGASNVFGHSGGAFIALHAGRHLPLERIAVYDPPLGIPGGAPSGFVEPFAEAVEAGDHVRAMSLMGQDLYGDNLTARLPAGLQRLLIAGFLRTPVGRRMADLLPTVVPEVRRIMAHSGTAQDYAGITADVLLARGARSPSYYSRICADLVDAIPRATTVTIPRVSHNAPNIAGHAFVRPFATFFAGSLADA
jgi:pimeloyl-ACP methyl ester carboxylesterase